jgi:hypothetical protein
MAAEAPLVLGPLGPEERKAMAAHYVAMAKTYYALARTLDPAAKVPKTPGRKRKGDEAAGGAAEPKKKRAGAVEQHACPARDLLDWLAPPLARHIGVARALACWCDAPRVLSRAQRPPIPTLSARRCQTFESRCVA